MKKFAFLITVLVFLDFAPHFSLALSCSITTSCNAVKVFKISSLTNAHAEFSDQTNYAYYVCCSEAGLGNSCSGSYTKVLKLSSATNAHVERKAYTNYPDSNAVCLSISNGNVDCQYASDCSTLGSNYKCLVSISSDTNAHVGDCNAYSTKVCCATNVQPPPAKPDLIIEDIWNVSSTVYYRIKNQGDANAGASTSKLWVDGVEKATDSVGSLAAGASSDESFSTYSWSCSGDSDTIKVCADVGNVVSESDENNNCREETWSCKTCYNLYRKCAKPETCNSNENDVACCSSSTDCVWNGVCYSSGSYHPVYDQCVYCSDGIWVSKQCGEHCRSLVGICSGGQNCWTKFGYQDNCPYLDCEAPTPPTGYIRSWVDSNCGRTGVYILYPYYNYPTQQQDSVCALASCAKTELWNTPTVTWSVVYPKPPSEHTYKSGEYVEIKVTISVNPTGFTPLLECRLKKFNKNNEFVGGIVFDSWVNGPFPKDITFRYKIKPNCQFCEKYHGATCSNCFGSDQSYGSTTKACNSCTGGDSIAQQYCSEGCDPSGNWVVDYCGIWTDFENNEGWRLKYDDTLHTYCVSTLLVPG